MHIDTAFAHAKTATRTFTAQEMNAVMSALQSARWVATLPSTQSALTELIASISEGWS